MFLKLGNFASYKLFDMLLILAHLAHQLSLHLANIQGSVDLPLSSKFSSTVVLNETAVIDIHTYGVCQSTIHDIWHMTYINMSIWVSKEALGPQECSQPS